MHVFRIVSPMIIYGLNNLALFVAKPREVWLRKLLPSLVTKFHFDIELTIISSFGLLGRYYFQYILTQWFTDTLLL
jgi:hypothetical protein